MELEKFTQKIMAFAKSFSLQTFAGGLFLSAVFLTLMINSSKTYTSEISILVSAKSENALKNQAQLVASVVELPKTLAFYDRLLKLNPDVRDVAAGKSVEQRKAKWNEMLSVQRAGIDSSVIEISISTLRQSDSEQLAGKTVRTLFDDVAFYYDVKNDVSLRIIDGPITKVHVSNLSALLLLSIVLGFLAVALLKIFVFSKKKISISKPDFSKINSFFDFKKNTTVSAEDELDSLNKLYESEGEVLSKEKIAALQENGTKMEQVDPKIQEMKKLTKKMEPSKYPNFPEMPLAGVSKNSAPDNLPIADDSFFAGNFEFDLAAEEIEKKIPEANENEIPVQASTEIEEQPIADQTPKEPTPEQLKERLNQLLRGDF
ncbi:MAG: hypothetical protein PHW24_01585 [Candidatus Moranbacteria bacterium]|nr:hypothetical protein [Candidatus Moranbacteria bacterium]